MSDPVRRVSFVTLGCKVNQADSEAMIGDIFASGAAVVDSGADVVVVNTCSVTGEADRKARKAVRHALAAREEPLVVVTGCLAALDAPGLRELGDRVIVEADRERVGVRVHEALELRVGTGETRSVLDAPPDRAGEATATAPAARRARVQLKVEDGCDAFCTYCVVPFARGLPRPVPFDRIIARTGQLVAEGVSEIVLTGINIGRYDDSGRRLADLVQAVAATNVRRIRISSIEPGDLTAELLDVIADTPAVCRHLHVPLQSGCDSVLAAMGRPYDTAAYARTLERVRGRVPGVAVSTDVIAGFPGETDVDAAATLAFVEQQEFSRLHVFRYSARTGTPAATMPGHVDPRAKATRSAELRALGDRLARRHADASIGSPAEVLIESVAPPATGRAAYAEGTTREYLRVRVGGASYRPGQLVPVTLGRVVGTSGVVGFPVTQE